MLREGKNFSKTRDNAIQGAAWFTQPFKTLYDRGNSGYYTGGYTEYQVQDEEGNYLVDEDGTPVMERREDDNSTYKIFGVTVLKHGSSALLNDTYNAVLTAATLGLMAKKSETNTLRESIASSLDMARRAMAKGKNFLFERNKPNGRTRANQFSKEWPNGSYKETLNNFAGDKPIVETTSKGKFIHTNPVTGMKVIYDVNGNYYRIQNTNLSGRRTYTDMGGEIPNNKTLENGNQAGRSQAEYNQVTHFNNTDPAPSSQLPIPVYIDDNDND